MPKGIQIGLKIAEKMCTNKETFTFFILEMYESLNTLLVFNYRNWLWAFFSDPFGCGGEEEITTSYVLAFAVAITINLSST